MKHLIGYTRTGTEVYVQLIGSQAARHISREPQLLALAKETLATITLQGQKMIIECDMKRPIGYSFTIETSSNDTVFYGCLLKDEVYTRFVKKGKPLPTQYLTLRLSQNVKNSYELTDVSIGRLMPPRPGSGNETAESIAFWSNHAYILDDQPLQPRTITKICPYSQEAPR